MGLFDAFSATTIFKYKTDITDAKRGLTELSGEQKKAAKAHIESMESQAEGHERMTSKIAKGAAVVVAGYALARDGLAEYQEESRLMAGAAGVDIGRLSEAYDGLKTNTELLTLAQSGHQGAWKLTTAQIELVVDGMRALEKKGFDAQKVFERFTEVMRKGKLEGLDEFGLALKATGNQAEDLKVLLGALGQEALSVGGDFEKAGDAATRGMARAEDGISRVRIMIGKATDAALNFAAAAGNSAGEAVFGPLQGSGQSTAALDYALALQKSRRGPNAPKSLIVGALEDGVDAVGNYMADANKIDLFRRNIRRIKNPVALDEALAALPADWQVVDPLLADRVERVRAELFAQMVVNADAFGDQALAALKNIAKGGKKKPANANRRGGSRSAANANEGSTYFDSLLETATGFAGFIGDKYAADQADQRSRMRQDTLLAGFSGASIKEDLDAAKSSLLELQRALLDASEKEKSFLAGAFGELWEFDAYTEAMELLGSTVQEVTGSIYESFARGEELSAASIKRLFAAEIAAEGKRLWARGVSGVLTGGFHVATGDPRGPGEIAAGAAMIAGAGVIGAVARGLGGGDASPATPAAGSGARGAAGAGRAQAADQRFERVVVLSGAFAEQSPRQRARQIQRSLASADTVYRPAGGSR